MLFADQWNNLDNAKAHYDSTGPEIWEQTNGKIDGFICSVGTGGTLAGTSRALKEKNKDIFVACADPHGFAMYELFKNGNAKSTPGDSITEGIGLGRVTPVVETAVVDDAFLISDEEAVTVIYELLEHEGLCLGGSTGINVAGAIRLAKQLGPGKTIVTILCRFRQSLSVKAVQSGFHALEEAAGAGMAREAQQHQRAVREGVTGWIGISAHRRPKPAPVARTMRSEATDVARGLVDSSSGLRRVSPNAASGPS